LLEQTYTDRSRNIRAKKTPDRIDPKQIAELGELAELRRQIPTDCGQLK
jgi:hypothetical protein